MDLQYKNEGQVHILPQCTTPTSNDDFKIFESSSQGDSFAPKPADTAFPQDFTNVQELTRKQDVTLVSETDCNMMNTSSEEIPLNIFECASQGHDSKAIYEQLDARFKYGFPGSLINQQNSSIHYPSRENILAQNNSSSFDICFNNIGDRTDEAYRIKSKFYQNSLDQIPEEDEEAVRLYDVHLEPKEQTFVKLPSNYRDWAASSTDSSEENLDRIFKKMSAEKIRSQPLSNIETYKAPSQPDPPQVHQVTHEISKDDDGNEERTDEYQFKEDNGKEKMKELIKEKYNIKDMKNGMSKETYKLEYICERDILNNDSKLMDPLKALKLDGGNEVRSKCCCECSCRKDDFKGKSTLHCCDRKTDTARRSVDSIFDRVRCKLGAGINKTRDAFTDAKASTSKHLNKAREVLSEEKNKVKLKMGEVRQKNHRKRKPKYYHPISTSMWEDGHYHETTEYGDRRRTGNESINFDGGVKYKSPRNEKATESKVN